MIYRLLLEYDGSAFHGWQVQPRQATVQGALEGALETVLGAPVRLVGSGRTDAGVHARGQVAHFKSDNSLDTFRLRRSLNGLTPHGIAVLAIEKAPEGFHARYDARQRRYHYYVRTIPTALERRRRVYLRPAPDFALMNDAARALIRRDDFSGFCRTRSETENRICDVRLARWVKEDHPCDWRFEVAADRFLHGMVRAMVGTLLQIGRRQQPAADLPHILASRDRREAGPAAPAHGLVLEEVTYDPPWQPVTNPSSQCNKMS